MKYLLPGVVLGVITGAQLMDQMELKHFNVVVGALVVGFVVSQVVKEKIFKSKNRSSPAMAQVPCAGLVSSSLAPSRMEQGQW